MRLLALRNPSLLAVLIGAALSLTACSSASDANTSPGAASTTSSSASAESSSDGSAEPSSATGGGDEACTQTHTIKYQQYPASLNNIVPVVAAAEGFFEKHCIEAEPVAVASAPAALAESVKGIVNMINTGPDNVVVARSNGLDVKIVGNFFKRDTSSLVISSKYADLKGAPFDDIMAGLVGKTIGVAALGGHNQYMAQTNFTQAGIDPTAATYVAAGGGAAMLAALQNGTVDAAEMYSNLQDIAEAEGFGFIVNDFRLAESDTNPVPDVVRDLNGSQGVWAVQASFLAQNQDAVTAFLAANDDAVQWILDAANRDKLYSLMEQEAPIPADVPNGAEVFKHSVDAYADMVASELDKESLQNYIDFTVQNAGVDPAKAPSLDELLGGL
jgi:ABC-type nitrate/sulfonate/bicarbonate transport system substrate-binding protein